MKLLLIQPAKPFFGTNAEDYWEMTRPFSLYFLASSVQHYTEHEVEILDFERGDLQGSDVSAIIRQSDADVYGITATTYTRFYAINIIRKIREYHPNATIIVGGVHFMYWPDETLRDLPEVDIVVCGEGEITIVELLKALDTGKDLADIKGISFRNDNNEVTSTPPQALIPNLDEIPNYKDFTWDEYPEYLFGYSERIPALSIMSSRGCPFKCVFCSKAGMKYRMRDADRTVDEIIELQDRFGINAFNFLDLTFTVNRKHTKEVCNALLKRKVDIRWWCESRVNIHLDLLDIMKEAGCASIAIGVESGSQRIIDLMSKGILVEQIVKFAEKCRELGIVMTPYFMFSHQGEEYEDVLETLQLIKELEKFTQPCSFQPTMIFPGTDLEMIARKEGKLPPDFSWNKPYDSPLNEELSQLSNTPLYIDKLTHEQMKELLEMKKVSTIANATLRESFGQLVIKAAKSVYKGKNSRKYILSPKFYRQLFSLSQEKRTGT